MDLKQDNILEQMNMEVSNTNILIGETYPIYGIITDIKKNGFGDNIIEINFNIEAKVSITDESKLETLRERAFEPGIFISKISSREEGIVKADCQTIVFGKKQSFNA